MAHEVEETVAHEMVAHEMVAYEMEAPKNLVWETTARLQQAKQLHRTCNSLHHHCSQGTP